MKRGLFLIIVLFQCLQTYSQSGFIWDNYHFDNRFRRYITYVPQKYFDENKAVPVIFALHGFGDNIDNFRGIGFHKIADTANFIVVFPEALPVPVLGSNGWNSGAALVGEIPFNDGVDDVGFLNSLMDTIMSRYMIDSSRVYFAGYSFGAFMCNRMACEERDRIAAIGTVSGTIGSALECNPGGSMPIIYFHGTSDNVIDFQTNAYGLPAFENLKFWVNNNTCNNEADTVRVPDIADDYRRIIHYTYHDCTQGDEVEFYKVNNGEHEWLFEGENDMDYNKTIWAFFQKWQRPQVPTGVFNHQIIGGELKVFPNPGQQDLYVDISRLDNVGLKSVQVLDLVGKVILEKNITQQNDNYIRLSVDASSGIYFIKVIAEDGKSKSIKWVKE